MTEEKVKKGFSGLQVTGIVAAVILTTVVVTLLVARAWLFPAPFQPVTLTAKEQQQLSTKLARLDPLTASKAKPVNRATPRQSGDRNANEPLEPQSYSEKDADREITFTEKELNALLANNTDLAEKLAIDLADNLISARMLIPVDPDFPFFGGKTLRVKAGADLAYRDGRPVVKLRGVSLMGVPVPNAWLGGMKNIDLVQEFGAEEGFWKAFADGVESINVSEGDLRIVLKE